jgi:predicted nicotinamide N-methyase
VKEGEIGTDGMEQEKAGGVHATVFATGPGTGYNGPVEVTPVTLGGVTVRVARPTDPDRLLDDPLVLDWNRRDDYMPYWAYLWPGAYLLAEAVASEHWMPSFATGAQALEVGCGLGLAGLFGLARGLRVQFTDYDPAPFEFVVQSAAENGFESARFSTRRLDWRALPDERFSLILGADVIYEAPLVPLVANLLGVMLAPGGLGLIASPYRVAAEAFPAALAAVGLDCRAEPAKSQTERGWTINGTVYAVTRPRPDL